MSNTYTFDFTNNIAFLNINRDYSDNLCNSGVSPGIHQDLYPFHPGYATGVRISIIHEIIIRTLIKIYKY